MPIPGDLSTRQFKSFLEATTVANQPAQVVCNPDGTPITSGGTSGGTSSSDGVAFTPSVSPFTPSGGEVNDTGPAVLTEGKQGFVRLTTFRAFHINLRTIGGVELGTATTPVRTDPTGGTIQPVSGTVTAAQTTGTNLHTVVDSGSITATQATGTNLHTVVDSGSITATQATGTNLHAVVDSGTVTANAGTGTFAGNQTQVAGTAIDVNTGNASAGTQRVVLASNQPAVPISGSVTATPSFGTRADTYTIVGTGVTVDVSTKPTKSYALVVKASGVAVSWTVVLEGSLDNVNFTTLLTHTLASQGDGGIVASGNTITPVLYFRSRVTAITLTTGNVTVTILGES